MISRSDHDNDHNSGQVSCFSSPCSPSKPEAPNSTLLLLLLSYPLLPSLPGLILQLSLPIFLLSPPSLSLLSCLCIIFPPWPSRNSHPQVFDKYSDNPIMCVGRKYLRPWSPVSSDPSRLQPDPARRELRGDTSHHSTVTVITHHQLVTHNMSQWTLLFTYLQQEGYMLMLHGSQVLRFLYC